MVVAFARPFLSNAATFGPISRTLVALATKIGEKCGLAIDRSLLPHLGRHWLEHKHAPVFKAEMKK
jgi:hypothetical protein